MCGNFHFQFLVTGGSLPPLVAKSFTVVPLSPVREPGGKVLSSEIGGPSVGEEPPRATPLGSGRSGTPVQGTPVSCRWRSGQQGGKATSLSLGKDGQVHKAEVVPLAHRLT